MTLKAFTKETAKFIRAMNKKMKKDGKHVCCAIAFGNNDGFNLVGNCHPAVVEKLLLAAALAVSTKQPDGKSDGVEQSFTE